MTICGEVTAMPNTKKLIVSAQLLALDVVLTRLLAVNTPVRCKTDAEIYIPLMNCAEIS